MNTLPYDVSIIGGGPAGSTAALYLAMAGWNVCVIEKKEFPRETLCGEFLSLEVIAILKELHLFEKFLACNPNSIDSFNFFSDNSRGIQSPLGFTAYGLRRSVLDNVLLTAAREHGVEIFQPCEIIDIEKSGNKFFLTAKDRDEKNILITSANVFAAYGRQNILDKALNRSFAGQKSQLNGIKFHLKATGFRNLKPNEIRIYVSDGIYCGVNHVDSGLVTVCFLENRETVKESSRQNLISCISCNENFRNIFSPDAIEQLQVLPAYGTGNIYFGKRNIIENGVLMIGDSAGVIAPLAGDGIGMALQSAKLVAITLIKSRNENLHPKEIEKQYSEAWENLFNKRIRNAGYLQNVLMHSRLRNAGIAILRLFPFILPKLIRATRGK